MLCNIFFFHSAQAELQHEEAEDDEEPDLQQLNADGEVVADDAAAVLPEELPELVPQPGPSQAHQRRATGPPIPTQVLACWPPQHLPSSGTTIELL